MNEEIKVRICYGVCLEENLRSDHLLKSNFVDLNQWHDFLGSDLGHGDSHVSEDWIKYIGVEEKQLTDLGCILRPIGLNDEVCISMIVGIKESEIYIGYLEEGDKDHIIIYPEQMIIKPGWNDTLRNMCSILRINYSNPNWYLTMIVC